MDLAHDLAHQQTEKDLARLERRVRKVYSECQKDIARESKSFWAHHKAKDKQLRKQLKAGEITQAEYDRWMRGQVFQGDRWQKKLDQITNTLTHTDQVAQGIINDQLNGVFANNANWMSYTLEHKAGVNFGFEIYDPSTVARLLRDRPELLPKYKLDIPKDQRWNQGLITDRITKGIILGKPLDQIARSLEKITDRDRNLCLTRARTAMTGAQNAGRQESLTRAQSMGIKVKKEWIATLDHHTRVSHAKLDGVSIPMNEKFKGELGEIEYPGDPHAPGGEVYNCRCTMAGDLVDYPDSYKTERYDNIEGKPIKDMSYEKWYEAKTGRTIDGGYVKKEEKQKKPKAKTIFDTIKEAKTVEAVAGILNGNDWFRKIGQTSLHGYLKGCDVESAQAICSAYATVFEKYPQLIGKFDPPSYNSRMGKNTYAWCYLQAHGKVEFNAKYFFNNFAGLQKSYESDVQSGWHPAGTDATSIIIHELGHAVDGLLTREGIEGSVENGRYKYASGKLRPKIMRECGFKVADVAAEVSRYGSTNAQEWFAECFAEYINSQNPRKVAAAFGKKLEELLKEVK